MPRRRKPEREPTTAGTVEPVPPEVAETAPEPPTPDLDARDRATPPTRKPPGPGREHGQRPVTGRRTRRRAEATAPHDDTGDDTGDDTATSKPPTTPPTDPE